MTTPLGHRRPTIKDVAEEAGVSHATVSRYLTKNSYVSEEAAKAVEAAIVAVNYVPNRSARSLVQQKSHFLAFIVREHSDLFFNDPNLSKMAVAANEVLGNAGYQMLLLIVDDDASATRVSDLVRGGFVDGAILVAMHHHDPVPAALADARVPMVTASSPLGTEGIPYVDTDNVGGTALITSLLLQTGRTRIAEIRGPRGAAVSPLRHEGFTQALGDLFDPRLVVDAEEWSREAGALAMSSVLDTGLEIDGVVAASDLLAAGALDVLQERGRLVPQDVGVVGFDDSPWATQTRPALSTVRQDASATGRRMAEIVLRQIEGENLRDHREILPNQIVWRDSAGTLATGALEAVSDRR